MLHGQFNNTSISDTEKIVSKFIDIRTENNGVIVFTRTHEVLLLNK